MADIYNNLSNIPELQDLILYHLLAEQRHIRKRYYRYCMILILLYKGHTLSDEIYQSMYENNTELTFEKQDEQDRIYQEIKRIKKKHINDIGKIVNHDSIIDKQETIKKVKFLKDELEYQEFLIELDEY